MTKNQKEKYKNNLKNNIITFYKNKNPNEYWKGIIINIILIIIILIIGFLVLKKFV